jgi:hypothetical protein
MLPFPQPDANTLKTAYPTPEAQPENKYSTMFARVRSRVRKTGNVI